MTLTIDILFILFGLIALIIAIFDFLFYRIPNVFVLGIIGLFILLAALGFLGTSGWESLKQTLMISGAFLLFGLLFYALKWMGAGDVKFMFASILWTSYVGLTFVFLFITSFIGGIIALICYFFPGYIDGIRLKGVDIIKERFKSNTFIMNYANQPFIFLESENRSGVRIPYGVAISSGVLFVVYNVLAGHGIQ